MDEKYFAKKVEAKWQKKWAESGAFAVTDDTSRPKFYQLEMLPYPSGNLHMGHVRNYSVGDALAWFKRLKGFNVLHPIGWDSFGQPAEDAAVKRGVNPRDWTEDNIVAMRGQLKRLGLSYDWTREIAAHRPEYYKWDQWFFLKMFERGLAYKKKTQVNWCENDQATLSNEQASGGLCWRCGNPVTKKELEQWFLKTTAYADQLLDDLKIIESGWPVHVIKRQRDWIGRSEGALLDFKIVGSDQSVRIFTTRIDTIYGASSIVLAPEHPIVLANRRKFAPEVVEKIDHIIVEKAKPVEHDAEIEKDGVDTGLRATNPFSGEDLPVWVGNYVMMDYGTGAVMSVPAHDERDFEFAKRFGLPVRQVISEPHMVHEHNSVHALALEAPLTEYGVLVHSDVWSGKASEDAKREMTAFAQKQGFGEAATTYRLRDWGISRQRFWGSPIPIVYCDGCGTVPVPIDKLPVELPENAPITGTGESPLAKVEEFVQTTCPQCSAPASRETDTMDTFVDSSWYFFRYLDPKNSEEAFGPEKAAYWTPVDQYIGGDDHAVMHLIYARFWTKVMRDLGLVAFGEPFDRLLTQGMVVGETFYDDSTGKRKYFPPNQVEVERDAKGRIISAKGVDGSDLKFAIERMSKSKGNGVDPDEMVDIYGADASRMFVLFAAPVDNELVWQEAGIEGAVRFLQRVWRLVYKWREVLVPILSQERKDPATSIAGSAAAKKLLQKTHQTIKRVDEALTTLQFNTPIAALMEFTNAIYESQLEPASSNDAEKAAMSEAISCLVRMLTPFAPHTAEELYSFITGSDSGMIADGARFPEFNSDLAAADEIEIAVQVNGKLRSRVFAAPSASNEEIERLALADMKISENIAGKHILKVIVVPGRLVNVVVRG
ncbi:leucine--tRNA ligase [Leptolyngbya sp. 7M]|uniref:leucine--tRNA ligase n=1 Tax=Leptolyngbya sp. 7M TaxID=2812896 RepID=UPI001B8CD0A5|nr:leucine--tRNA ligase [Leptolyngbya sp. 7M]QYO66143.1 leucine--tRNA ligase [Leptolyngbya sp. 7M]